MVSWLKFMNFFLFNAGEIVVDNTVYRLSISPSVPEIFALKVHALTHARMHEHTHTQRVRKHNASGHYAVVGGGIKIQ